MQRRLVPVLAMSVMASLAPGIATAAPSSAPTAAAAKAPSPYAKQKLTWKSCGADTPKALQCATVKVPMDYKKPGGKKITVAVSRMKTSVKGKRHGVLFSNPGGPGGSGLTLPVDLKGALPKSVLDRYDLIGFDPRGVGASTPVTCGLSDSDMMWPRPYTQKTFATDVAWAKGVAEKCRKKSGDKLAHTTTRNTARDMDVIRAALGEKKINYLGYSYGTYLGAVYNQLFPKRSDRFILDSAVDPKLAWRGMIQVWAEGTEPAFKRWTQWSAQRNAEYQLGDTSAKVSKTFWDIIAQADRKPLVIEGEKYTGTDLRGVMRGIFFSAETASLVVADLKQIAAGQATAKKRTLSLLQDAATGFAKPAKPVKSGGYAAYDNGDAAFWAVACGDNTAAWPKDTAQYAKDAARDKKRYPLYGDFGSNIKPCAFWKKGPESVTKVDNKVPSLILQNEWDSQTPLSTAQGMHKALKGSKMVTVKGGEGHGVYLFGGNACADKAATGYLTTGKLPSKDVTCKASTSARKSGAANTSPLPQNRF